MHSEASAPSATPSKRLTLLARNRAGYGLLCRLLTASHENREKGTALLSWDRLFHMLSQWEEARGGLLALYDDETNLDVLHDFFRERLYWPLCRVLDGMDRERTEQARAISLRYGVPIVATNDVHFHVPARRRLQDALTAIRLNQSLDQCGRSLFPNFERYLKSAEEMARLFADLPEAIARTVEIAEQCTFSPSELRYRYPSEWIPSGETAQSYLEGLVWKGARWRYGGEIPTDVERQLRHELRLIDELRFADYFLTIWEIVEFAKARDILCQGRGSAANSAICFCLGITAIDPVRMNLLFERFLSVERGEPPDIDVDFEHERREEVIQHIYEKYGRHRAAMVSAVITYRSRSTLRDLSKALGVDPEKVPEHPAGPQLMEEISGLPRHLSIHSGGFTLSADPMIEIVPVEPARMEGRTIIQWDKEDLAIIGLLKVDVLALGMLTAIRKALDLAQPKAPGLSLATVPPEDPKTYEMIRKAETVGVFQIESRAQMNMLGRLLPRNFYDLVIEVAIVRPGPIVGQMVHPFLKRRRGLEPIDMPDPRLEPILGRTLGVPLFQEQVMKMAMMLAGFTPGEADQLRRAIGAWRGTGTIEKMGKKLREGLLASRLPQEFVERVFLQVQGFAEYGFPESHAASFALLAYVSSYLKCHFPAEFTCALINSQPMGFYSTHTLVEEAKRQGVRVLSVDPNRSEWDCCIERAPYGATERNSIGEALRIGLRVVRGISRKEADQLVEERARGGRFKDLADFLWRVKLRPQVLYALAMGGAFECFNVARRDALWTILAHQEFGGRAGATGTVVSEPQQLSLFEGQDLTAGVGHASAGPRAQAQFSSLSRYETIQSDYRSYGLSTRGHPMSGLRELPALKRLLPPMTSATVRAARMNANIRAAGLLIVRQRPPTAKGTSFATLEDEHGFLDLVLHQEVFERYKEVFLESPFVIVNGRVQRDGVTINVIVASLTPLRVDTLQRVREVNFR